MNPIDPVPVIPSGEWTHSQEEDEDEVLVYRRAESFAFPPTRAGRDGLRVSPSGQIVALAPGADDRPRPTGIRVLPGEEQPDDDFREVGMLEVLEASPTVLRIRRR